MIDGRNHRHRSYLITYFLTTAAEVHFRVLSQILCRTVTHTLQHLLSGWTDDVRLSESPIQTFHIEQR